MVDELGGSAALTFAAIRGADPADDSWVGAPPRPRRALAPQRFAREGG
jgi:hypothetical protein